MSVDSQTGVKIDAVREIALDLTRVTEFTSGRVSLDHVLARSVADFGLLVLFSLAGFAAVFLMFLRYDVRYAAG